MTTWITGDDVAAYLSLLTDDKCEEAAAAAQAWVERQRPDLSASFATGNLPADLVLGAKMYAALLYQSGVNPAGLPSSDELGTYTDLGPSLMSIYRLIGSRRPKAC